MNVLNVIKRTTYAGNVDNLRADSHVLINKMHKIWIVAGQCYLSQAVSWEDGKKQISIRISYRFKKQIHSV